MLLSVILEVRCQRTPDGRVWTNGVFPHSFWRKYLEVFDGIHIAARIEDVPAVPSGSLAANGERVTFKALPYYVGPMQYAQRYAKIRRAAREIAEQSEAIILRVPSALAESAIPAVKSRNQPYGVEVVGDPHDVFAEGAVRHPLRPFFRWWFTKQLKGQVAGAAAVHYVTRGTLQTRYPSATGAFATHYSDVELPEEAFAGEGRLVRETSSPCRIVTVGSLEQMYKGIDVLLEAVSQCVRGGLELRLTVVGDGKHRAELEAMAAGLGLGERVRFAGQLPKGAGVRVELDAADLFVLPSRTEGLPRALIEAMARGLPCLGSTAGGIPELLEPEEMAPPGDAEALARLIEKAATHPGWMTTMSWRNLRKAQDYTEARLHERRVAFLKAVRAATEDWLKGRQ